MTDTLRGLLQDGEKLLKAVEKIPRRTSLHDRPSELAGEIAAAASLLPDRA